MNCERAERLLPLHAGGDLEDGRERAELAAHLGGCQTCRRREAEWAESVRLLRLDEPPEFDAAFFDPIRRNVMREITADVHAKPSLATLLAQLLRPKPLAYAASLMLVCAALLFAFRLSRAPQPSKLAGGGVAAGLSKPLLFENEPPKSTPPRVIALKDTAPMTRASKPALRGDRRTATSSSGAQLSVLPLTPRDESGDATRHPIEFGAISLPAASPLDTAAPSPLPATTVELAVIRDEREMLKIDLQTRDPDVRIIWFSPQPDAQASPRSTNDKR